MRTKLRPVETLQKHDADSVGMNICTSRRRVSQIRICKNLLLAPLGHFQPIHCHWEKSWL